MAEEIEAGVDQQGFKQTAKDLVAGAAGGVAQVLIGQPFDIVKVRLQTTTQYSGAFDAAAQIWRHEGPLAFYKGTLTPLIGIGACVSVQFGGFHYARRQIEAYNGTPTNTPLSLPQYYAAGAFAGVVNSVLSGPIEHVRIRLQTQPHNPAQRLYSGPWSCITTLVNRAGVGHGLFRGQAVTVLREAQAYGAWFLTFEWLMAQDVKRRGIERKEIEAWRVGLYGGIAGEMLWATSYPFDVIKSRMQSDGLGVGGGDAAKQMSAAEGAAGEAQAVAEKQFGQQRFKSMRDCFAQTFREDGFRGFFRGIGPTLVRAMPVSAATFVVAELTTRMIADL